MRKAVYIETSIISYLTSVASRDIRVAAWQQVTAQWWSDERSKYRLFTSELVLLEASRGDESAGRRRLECLRGIHELRIDEEVRKCAECLLRHGAIPKIAEVDALHVAIGAVHGVDYLLTWNCRHIDNAVKKPLMREVCKEAGYTCPEICTPLELLKEDDSNVQ